MHTSPLKQIHRNATRAIPGRVFVRTHMSVVCTHMLSICQSYVPKYVAQVLVYELLCCPYALVVYLTVCVRMHS